MIATRHDHRMRVVFAGGGSGGHLYPGLALAEELRRRHEGRVETHFLATERPIDRIILERQGVPWEPLQTLRPPGAPRMRAALRAAPAFGNALHRIRRLRPDVVVGLGGYGSIPPCVAAAGLRTPIFLLEPNRVPGRANRLLSRLAREVWIHFDQTRESLPRGSRAFRTGNPLRGGLHAVPTSTARISLGLDPSRPTLLVLGGSQGASGLNRRLVDSAPSLRRRVSDLQVIHLAGSADREEVEQAYRQAAIPARVPAYLEEMHVAYSAADLVIARAGAGTLAEITALGLAALLVPYPHHRDQHQLANALSLAGAGAAEVVPEDEANRFEETVARLLADGACRERMAERSKGLGCPEAASAAVRRLEHWDLLTAVAS